MAAASCSRSGSGVTDVTPAEARERYGVTTSHAEPGDHVTGDDGTELVVLESARDGTRKVVHADLFQFSRTEILAAGLAGLVALLAVLMTPIAAALWVGLTTPNLAVTIGATLGGVVVAFYASNLVLYRTVVHDWIFRFLEWSSHKALVESFRQRGEA